MEPPLPTKSTAEPEATRVIERSLVEEDVRIPALADHNPLHASFYADRAHHARVSIKENVQIARDTFRLRIECPEIARQILPGQFVMLRIAGCNDPLLGRPLAVYDVLADSAGIPVAIDLVYLVLGKMTRVLAQCCTGDELEIWGPLGNGFPAIETEHLIMVAGGIGQTPFLLLGQEYLGAREFGDPPRSMPKANRVTLCYGVRTADLVAGVADFKAAGFDVQLSSDDGSLGHHGLVTDLVATALDGEDTDRLVICCGPEPMMHAVATICKSKQTRCLASLETPMACGIGICFSCVTKVRQKDGSWDWERTCVEGPIFDATHIEW
jgi:dihydroorotate dehydrogenase electron transfer subunit